MPGIYNGVLIARVNTDVELAEFEIAVRNLVNNVENAYWDLYFAYRDLDAKTKARDATLDTWRRVRALYDAGRRGGEAFKEAQAREQYFRFQEEVENALSGRLIDGTRTGNGSSGGTFRANGGVHVAERRLRLLIGLPPSDGRLLRPADEPLNAPVAFDWSEITRESVMRRTELRRQRFEIRRRELEWIASKNFLMPRFDAVGRYRWRGFGHDLLNSSGNNPRFDNAYEDLTSGDFQEWQVGLELTVPIGYRRGFTASRNAELLLCRERAILREQEHQVLHEVASAVADMERAFVVSQTSFNRLDAARVQLDAIRAEFEAEKAPLDLLLDAQRRLAEADSQHHRALAEFAIAVKNVHFAKGTLLDYDDLLLYWYYMMAEPDLARQVGDRFDHVLVDEYQDTNALQAAILLAMKPDGRGLTVVGDDAQSIYAFRAASVRNILDFPNHFDPPARVVTLEENYRSTQSILDACNAVIALSSERYTKRLFSSASPSSPGTRVSREKPVFATVEDESEQVEYVVEQILEHREAGIDLKRQAVLMRTAHHSDQLEVELSRRNIPYVKFGGLKFLEAAHVKDMLSVLRFVENPRDAVAAFRVLQLLPGVGPGNARRAMDHLSAHHYELASLRPLRMPAAAAGDWPLLCRLLVTLRDGATEWSGQIGMLREWYGPHLERLYDAAHVRASDLEQLEQIASGYTSRERFLTELTLDPPDVTGDQAGEPLLDEDYLILSTIHSAKGQEWDAVYLLNAADGCIPSDMSTGSPEQIEEERRLLYVAMTRAREHLHVVHPLRFFKRQQHRFGDAHVLTPRSRFITDAVLEHFHRRARARPQPDEPVGTARSDRAVRIDVGARLRSMWS